MKRGLLGGVFIFLFLINFVSAFSFSEAFSFIDPTLLTLAVLFVVFFGALYFSVSKIFKGNTSVAAVIAVSLSLLLVYWINNLVSISALFSGLGISDETLYILGPILFMALAVFLLIKLRFGILVLVGGVLVLAGATNLVYSTTLIMIIGGVLIVAGIIGLSSKKGRIRTLMRKYTKIQRRNPNDPRLRDILFRINKLKPGFGQMKP